MLWKSSPRPQPFNLAQDVRLGATQLHELDIAGCGKLARLAMPLLEAPLAQLRAAADAAPKVRAEGSGFCAVPCAAMRSNTLQVDCELGVRVLSSPCRLADTSKTGHAYVLVLNQPVARPLRV